MNKAHPAAHGGSPDAAFCSARNCRTVIKSQSTLRITSKQSSQSLARRSVPKNGDERES